MTNFTFTFETREEYLKYRSEWKSKYMENSEQIRELKQCIKQTQKSGNCAARLQSQREYLRCVQHNLMFELIQAKIRASEQYKKRINEQRKVA